MTDPADTIRNIPLFSGLAREDIAKILGKLEESTFEPNTTIFSQGDRGDSFYIILSGAVQIVLRSAAGRDETLSVLGPQDSFGEMALLSGEPRSASVIAVKETTVWRLSREDWNELIAKHPTWLLQFCATLSKRLAHVEERYFKGRDVFIALAEEFYNAKTPAEQQLLRRLSLLTAINPETVEFILQTEGSKALLETLEKSPFPLLRSVENGRSELQVYFRDFLQERFSSLEGENALQRLHAQIAAQYEALTNWGEAVHHWVEAGQWSDAARILVSRKEELLASSAALLKDVLEGIPPDVFASDARLVHIKADTLARLGDFAGAVRNYEEVLSHKASDVLSTESMMRYRNMAAALARSGDYAEALKCLHSALNLVEQGETSLAGDLTAHYWEKQDLRPSPPAFERGRIWPKLSSLRAAFSQKSLLRRWAGGILGLAAWAYLWFTPPEIGLEPAAIKQMALLSLALIYWAFWVFPEHGVALLFVLALILAGLETPENALHGFASTTWFMSLGVLGLGAAITGSGLFYRVSLQLVRSFPLTYYWQTLALGFMGVVVAALIPQKSARTGIISQMILNLSESLGYKTPSSASTGLFASAFLGLGQLNFLYLTGSTATLLAWGLLPDETRAQFTWGYWFLAASIPAAVAIAVVLCAINFLYRPEVQARISYKMVGNQLQILGALSREEWLTLGVLLFTIVGWLTFSYHGIHAAWISLLGLCILINAGVLGWTGLKKGIDWEFLLYLGAIQNVPSLLTKARIDAWLGELLSPFLLPFAGNLVVSFIVIVLFATALKLAFTQRLTVITLVVALVPLSARLGIDPWVTTMIILIGSEPWFFRYQIDWHTLANSITEGKGFTYSLMYRINFFFVLAYILAVVAAIPYWRYLGLLR